MLLHGLESLMRLLLLGRSGIEHRTLRLRYRHRHFLLRVPFGTREAAALWPGAGHAAPASDFLEILILESLDARLVAAFPASIFMAVEAFWHLLQCLNKRKNADGGALRRCALQLLEDYPRTFLEISNRQRFPSRIKFGVFFRLSPWETCDPR